MEKLIRCIYMKSEIQWSALKSMTKAQIKRRINFSEKEFLSLKNDTEQFSSRLLAVYTQTSQSRSQNLFTKEKIAFMHYTFSFTNKQK